MNKQPNENKKKPLPTKVIMGESNDCGTSFKYCDDNHLLTLVLFELLFASQAFLKIKSNTI